MDQASLSLHGSDPRARGRRRARRGRRVTPLATLVSSAFAGPMSEAKLLFSFPLPPKKTEIQYAKEKQVGETCQTQL